MKISTKKIQKLYDCVIKALDKVIEYGTKILKANQELNQKVTKLEKLIQILENAKKELKSGE